MAYRELGVIEIREVLRRFCLGQRLRAIARGTGSDRKTIAKYVAAAVAAGLARGGPGPTDAQVAAGAADVDGDRWARRTGSLAEGHPGPGQGPDGREAVLEVPGAEVLPEALDPVA
jgi:hypothetical protein